MGGVARMIAGCLVRGIVKNCPELYDAYATKGGVGSLGSNHRNGWPDSFPRLRGELVCDRVAPGRRRWPTAGSHPRCSGR